MPNCGEERNTRMPDPLKNADGPSCFRILVTQSEMPEYASSPSRVTTCNRVLITSAGVVRAAAESKKGHILDNAMTVKATTSLDPLLPGTPAAAPAMSKLVADAPDFTPSEPSRLMRYSLHAAYAGK